jgi:predicted RNA binding protein YcfA (HicA-like mRNA interferase family)
VYTVLLTGGELMRFLAEHGCTFTEGKKHTLAHYKGRFAPIPRHGRRELKTGTVKGILKQLGITEAPKRP